MSSQDAVSLSPPSNFCSSCHGPARRVAQRDRDLRLASRSLPPVPAHPLRAQKVQNHHLRVFHRRRIQVKQQSVRPSPSQNISPLVCLQRMREMQKHPNLRALTQNPHNSRASEPLSPDRLCVSVRATHRREAHRQLSETAAWDICVSVIPQPPPMLPVLFPATDARYFPPQTCLLRD